MTSMHKHTYYGAKALQSQYLNTICGNHDLMCSCDDPLKHTALLILQKAKPTFTDEERKLLKDALEKKVEMETKILPLSVSIPET